MKTEPCSGLAKIGVSTSTSPIREESGHSLGALVKCPVPEPGGVVKPICAGEHAPRPLAPDGLRVRPSGNLTTDLRRCAVERPSGSSLCGIFRLKLSPVGESAALVVGLALRLGSKLIESQPVIVIGSSS